MKYMRKTAGYTWTDCKTAGYTWTDCKTAGYTWTDCKTNTEIANELHITPVLDTKQKKLEATYQHNAS
jgi:hypothetical protein